MLLLLPELVELLPSLKWTRVMSRAVQVGSEMDTMMRRTRAQKRKMIPGMQKARLIVIAFGCFLLYLLLREDRAR